MDHFRLISRTGLALALLSMTSCAVRHHQTGGIMRCGGGLLALILLTSLIIVLVRVLKR